VTPSRGLDLFTARSRATAVTWLILLAVAALLFWRLDDRLLWGDEAETALLARNITRYGLPRTFDGVNRITLLGEGVDSSRDQLWTWSPWLAPYTMAASFALAGASTLAARLPFALAAWASVALLGLWLWRRYGDRQIAWMGMAYLGGLELFVLHGRQARYYGLALLAQALVLWALHATWEGDARGRWYLAGAVLVHFYSNYILAVACGAALAAIALASRRAPVRRDVGIALAVSALGGLPWILYARSWAQSQMMGGDEPAGKLLYYVRETHFHVVPWVVLAVPLAWWWIARRPRAREGRGRLATPPRAGALLRSPWTDPLARSLLLFFPAVVVAILPAPGAYLRYLLPLLAVAAVLVAVSVASLPASWGWRWLVLAVLISSNAVAWLTAWPFSRAHGLRPALTGVIDEISHRYADRTAAVVDFFNGRVSSTETAFGLDPEFPLIFYTRLRIVDGRLTGGRLPDPAPEWILPRSAGGVHEQGGDELPASIAPFYERLTLSTPASSRLGSLPEPDVREYRTAPGRERFVLYRKIGASPAAADRR
jgi:4-amino-4-deoxy-L-arabinose transferase-like glycosyltransferase